MNGADGEGAATGPLHGIRVIELGTLLAGPYAGQLLGDWGAEVVKIEAPGHPDPMRDWGTDRYNGRTLWWPVVSRNKRSITLDLRVPEGQRLLLELVRRADALVENFRPGTLEKWGVGPDRLLAENPGLVVTRVSGFGQTGPYRERPGFASVAEAMGGLRYVNGVPGQPPPRVGISLGDSVAGMLAAQATLAALYWRDARQGRGQVVDVSLTEACFSLLEAAVPEYDLLGKVRHSAGTRLEGAAPSNVFMARDGRWVVIAANQDNLFRRLCEAMERPDLGDDPRFATARERLCHQDELDEQIALWAKERDSAAIVDLLNGAGVVCGPVYSVADIVDDPQFQARDMIIEYDDPDIGTFRGPGVVPKFSATPGSVRFPGRARPGMDNESVYGDLLGLTADEQERLAAERVI